MRWFLARLFGPPPEAPRPITSGERSRLSHRRRSLEREIRRREKLLERIGCSTCVSKPVDRRSLALSQATSALRAELREIEARLAS